MKIIKVIERTNIKAEYDKSSHYRLDYRNGRVGTKWDKLHSLHNTKK